nr:MAG TPA: hypothetical protein [Caudoviricetes sp.]
MATNFTQLYLKSPPTHFSQPASPCQLLCKNINRFLS